MSEHITDPQELALYYQAIDHFGAEHQMGKAVEEMAELTVEIVKHLHGAPNIAAMGEELMDVWITLDQLLLIIGPEWGEYMRLKKAEKLAKLEALISQTTEGGARTCADACPIKGPS